MARHVITAVPVDGGFRFDLTRLGTLGLGRKTIPFSNWDAELHPAVGLLKLMFDNDAARERDGGAYVDDDIIASMPSSDTAMLSLPPRCPHALHLEGVGALTDPDFNVRVSWLAHDGNTVVGLRRQGVLLESVVDRFLLAEPLYSVLVEIKRLNELQIASGRTTLDARMVQFDRLKMALAGATGDVHADTYLDRLTIHHATGIAIEPKATGIDYFEPVLFGDAPPPPDASPENEEVSVVRRPLLPDEHDRKFRSILFPKQGSRTHYRFAEGVYAVVDAPVEAALRVVERVNAADAATRAAFRADPRSFLTEAIEEAGGSGDVVCEGAVMRAVTDYGERVLGIHEWDGTSLSFKVPVYRKWFPDEDEANGVYTIELPGALLPLVVRQDEVAALRDAVDAARMEDRQDLSFNGRTYPVTADLQDTISKLVGLAIPRLAAKPSKDGPQKAKLLVLRVAENEEDLSFNARLRDPEGSLARVRAEPPLATKPLPHQVDGVAWLRLAFLSGMPGVLLADDMGLGKTFQVLAFLHWLRRNEGSEKRPILVVAPKKLLDVWRDEIKQHLGAEGLGRPVLVYDEHVGRLKVASGKDGGLGRHTLDVATLREADWVLTTYETMRDYHISFAAVRFRIGIYDEAQKMKSMASLINNAAKGQQPDFTILMTGTPIENSVMDLWTLLDVAWPGFIPMSGKEFASAYGEKVTPERLAELKARLVEPVTVGDRRCPPIMLRRFKTDVLVGLPRKTERIWREEMSAEQTRAYDAVLADQKARSTTALQAIQALRSAAFHPGLRMPSSSAEHAAIIAASARFRSLFRILDDAHAAGERVLVFVDLHLGQRVLSELIRHRYRMPRHPQVINGDTATKALNQIKDDFQLGTGFNVLLLGPRSAGFGLTLTSANHVVHMNRWWNPAVEDQCSDRVYRMKQTRDVFIHLPIAVHPRLGDASFDVVLNGMLEEKRGLSRDIVVPTVLTESDFRRMFTSMMDGASAPDAVLDQVDLMGWQAFEAWTAESFSLAGYQPYVTPRSGDGGADILLRPPLGNARPVICQCKHRALGGRTDEQAVQDVLRARTAYSGKYPWLKDPTLLVVTNGRMAVAATSLATEHHVTIVDRSRLAGLVAMAGEMARGSYGTA